MGRARPDVNNNFSLIGVSNADGVTPVEIWVDPNTHQLLTNATGGSSSGVIVDGVDSLIKATVKDLVNSNPVTVAIVDTNGDQIASFGGGTQYAELATTAPGTGTLALGRYKSSPATLTDGQLYGLQLDVNGALKVSGGGGGTQYVEDVASAGGESMTLAGVVRQDTIASSTSTDGDYAYLKVNSVGRLYTSTTIDAALPAGTNAIGKLAANSGVTIGAVEIAASQTVGLVAGAALIGKVGLDQTTPGTTNAVSLAQIGATTVATGNGVVGAGVQRVAIASDNTAFAVNATLSAETTKVIGTINLSAAQTLATVTTVGTVTNITNWGNIVDNAGFTDGTTRLSMSGYIFDEVAGTALTENDAAAARINSNRAQVFVMEDGATRARYQTVTTRGSSLVEGPTASDAVLAAAPVTTGGKASNAVPTAMSADGDVVDRWHDRNGRTVVVQNAATSTLTNVTASASTGTVLASNAGRKGAIIYNDSTVVLYLKLGATASTTSFTVKMQADDYYEVPFGYTGVVDGIWASATGSARVTELT